MIKANTQYNAPLVAAGDFATSAPRMSTLFILSLILKEVILRYDLVPETGEVEAGEERIKRILQHLLRSSGKQLEDQSFLFPGIQRERGKKPTMTYLHQQFNI